ncbi:MAG: iron-containing alcohol dehydrogenase [Thermoproteales archaeon]|nr:iron-containing alcohol dehydrogenase [Thermoproteales archaeon]
MLAWASMLAGYAIDVSRVALAHAMEHAISTFHLKVHHGIGLAVILSIWAEYTRPAAIESFAEIAELLGVETAHLNVEEASMKRVQALIGLLEAMGTPKTLSDIGIKVGMWIPWSKTP